MLVGPRRGFSGNRETYNMWCVVIIVLFICLYVWKERQRRERVGDLHAKYILVTGCDSGFGYLLAKKLETLGCHVFATCLTETGKYRLQTETSERVKAMVMNVTSEEDVKKAFDFVKKHIPNGTGLWGLVNNAGIMTRSLGPLEWQTVEDAKQVFEVNFFGICRVTNAFLPLVKAARGRIVNTSSISGRLPGTFTIPYSASKAAVESFSDSIRSHLEMYGVSVHILEPSAFQTDIIDSGTMRNAVETGWRQSSPEIQKEFGEEYKTELTRNRVDMKRIQNLNLVVDAYVDALTSVCPRSRYSVGFSSRYVIMPLSYAPTFIQDWFRRQQNRGLVPACLKAAK